MPSQDQDQPILDLHSDPVQEIIGKDPAWIIRWGITIVFFTVIVLLLGTYVIKYPDIVTARVSVTTDSPPARVIARGNGKIVTFFVDEGDKVASGDYLAILENTADYQHVIQMRDRLNNLTGFLTEPESFLDLQWDKNVVLGELQVVYSEFLRSFTEYQNYINQNFQAEKIKAIERQITQYQDVNNQLQEQKQLLQKDLANEEKAYERNKRLLERELISLTDFETIESGYLSKKIAMSNADNSLVNNRIRIQELRRNILDLQQDRKERGLAYQITAQNAFKQLVSELDAWEQRFVLQAPTGGVVSFFRFWSPNQYVEAGEEVLSIVPSQDELVGKIYLPQAGAGKVDIGQKVNIKFDSFPFNEFGMVIGEVATTSLIARENQYLINVSLPNQLHTTYRKDLEFKHNMEGTADIITDDMRLIERIFNQFRHLFQKNFA